MMQQRDDNRWTPEQWKKLRDAATVFQLGNERERAAQLRHARRVMVARQRLYVALGILFASFIICSCVLLVISKPPHCDNGYFYSSREGACIPGYRPYGGN